MNTSDSAQMGYYVIKFVSEAYKLHEETSYNGKISTSDELFANTKYLNFMQENKNIIGSKDSSNKLSLF